MFYLENFHHIKSLTEWDWQASITVTSEWARWRLKSPAFGWLAESFNAQIKKQNIKAPHHWLLCGEFTGQFPAQRASNAENVSIWWRHHAIKSSLRKSQTIQICVSVKQINLWFSVVRYDFSIMYIKSFSDMSHLIVKSMLSYSNAIKKARMIFSPYIVFLSLLMLWNVISP